MYQILLGNSYLKKKSLWNKIKKNPNKTLKSRYNYTAKAIKLAIKQLNERTLSKLTRKRNQKKFYSHINNKLSRETNNEIKITNMDKPILDNKESSEKFALFFQSTFTYDDDQTPKLDDFQLNSKLTDIVFNTDEIIMTLKIAQTAYL